jgi:hypothetical protein
MQDHPKPPPSHFEQPVRESRIEGQYKQLALSAMQYFEGYCSEEKALDLMDLVWFIKPKVVVEVGMFGGKSLVPMGFALKAVGSGIAYGIYSWGITASVVEEAAETKKLLQNVDYEAILSSLKERLKQFNIENSVKLKLADAQPIFDIDILHIAVNHSEEALFLDLDKWVSYVRKGGIIILGGVFPVDETVELTNWLDEHCTRMKTLEDINHEWAIWIK